MTEKNALFASRADLVTTVVVAGIAVLWILWSLAMRLVEILPNRDVPVLVGTVESARLPLGPDGEMISASIQQAALSVTGMPGGLLFAVVLSALVPAVAALVIIGCSTIVLVNLLRARFFNRMNTRLIATISVVIAVSWLLSLVLQAVAGNGAVALLSGGSLEAVTFQLDFTALLISMGIGCLGAAFRAGERLQRDTEGLI